MDEKLRLSCANCQLVCCPNKKERRSRYKMLTESGVLPQNADGSLTAVSAEDVAKRFAAMPDFRKALYQNP